MGRVFCSSRTWPSPRREGPTRWKGELVGETGGEATGGRATASVALRGRQSPPSHAAKITQLVTESHGGEERGFIGGNFFVSETSELGLKCQDGPPSRRKCPTPATLLLLLRHSSDVNYLDLIWPNRAVQHFLEVRAGLRRAELVPSRKRISK